MVQKSENQSQKKTVDTVDKKKSKKAKIKGQNSCFDSVDNLHRHLNKKKALKAKIKGQNQVLEVQIAINSPKIGPKKRKSEPEKAMDTVDKKKA